MRILTAAGNGNGEAVTQPQTATPDADRFATLYVWGEFDGATVTLEVSPGGDAPWFDAGIDITDTTAVNIENRGRKFRGVVTDGGISTSINAVLI